MAKTAAAFFVLLFAVPGAATPQALTPAQLEANKRVVMEFYEDKPLTRLRPHSQ